MWILIECDDPTTGPGHNEKRRFILPDTFNLTMNGISNSLNDISNSLQVTFKFGSEMHPCTPGDEGYHCPICYKDIKGKPQSEEDIIESIKELRKEFEDMATKKMFIMTRSKKTGGIGGEYTSPNTFCLWAGYWEYAVKIGIIPDKIEYINEG